MLTWVKDNVSHVSLKYTFENRKKLDRRLFNLAQILSS